MAPHSLEDRNTVGINAETVTDVSSKEIPGHYPGEDHAWDANKFRKSFRVKIHRNTPNEAIFSFIGLDASIANAFRRILLSSLPTLAIEDVFIENNTSIIQDEVLAHRLGLIPLKGSKQGLRWLKWRRKGTEEDPSVAHPSTDFNTIVMSLDIECSWKEKGREKSKKGETDPNVLYNNPNVYAHHLKYEPVGQQATTYFTEAAGPIAPVHPNILIAKLRPGQVIHLKCYATLGLGSDHAKFSPVATATYRLLPSINILQPILDDDAVKFQHCFPRHVIDVETVTQEESEAERGIYKGLEGRKKAVVADEFRDTVTRECLRHPEFEGKVKLGRHRDHFIYHVESTGQWDSQELVVEAIKALKMKCARVKRDFATLRELNG